jgi:hypothetical protein
MILILIVRTSPTGRGGIRFMPFPLDLQYKKLQPLGQVAVSFIGLERLLDVIK